MKSVLFLSLILATASSFAHDERDWRHDYLAYLNLEYHFPQNTRALSQSRIDMQIFKEKLAILTGNAPVPGTTNKITERKSDKQLDLTRLFLDNEFKALGFETSFHPFASGKNFIAEKKGTKNPEKVLILSAHIDSVGNNGANDDGTGVAGLLSLARELSKYSYPYTLRILGFDREEKRMAGSYAYVALIEDKTNIIGNIHFEMFGFHSRNDGAFHLIDCDNFLGVNRAPKFGSEQMSAIFKESIAELKLDLTVVKTCTGRSDHSSFWRNKIPAIVISENFFGGDPDPCYHSRCDVMDERLNYEYMQKILEAALVTTEKLLR
jgi:putative aminopeptidase FrvX